MTDEEKRIAISLTKSIAAEMGVSISETEALDIVLKCAGDKSCIRTKVENRKIKPSVEMERAPIPPFNPLSPSM